MEHADATSGVCECGGGACSSISSSAHCSNVFSNARVADLGLDSLSTATLLSLLHARMLIAAGRASWGLAEPPLSYAALLGATLGELAALCEGHGAGKGGAPGHATRWARG